MKGLVATSKSTDIKADIFQLQLTMNGIFRETRTSGQSVMVSLVTVLFYLASVTSARPASEKCHMGNHTYDIGETWQPALCANCSCLEGGRIKCQGPECPRVDCDEPKQPHGQCCPTCDDPTHKPTSASGEEARGQGQAPTLRCDYLDRQYEIGDAFPSNQSGIRKHRDDQCVLCHCMRNRKLLDGKYVLQGEVRCILQTCVVRPGCSKLVTVTDDCCPVCADDVYEGGDCVMESGQIWRNGTTWQPHIVDQGAACATCTCLDGKIDCDPLDCPSDSLLPCDDPRHQQGECCKTCPGRQKALDITGPLATPAGGGAGGGGGGVSSWKGRRKDRKKKPGKGKRKKKRCKNLKGKDRKKCRRRQQKLKKRRRKNRKSSGKRMKIKADMRIHTVISRLCLPDDTSRLVYRDKGAHYESLFFDGPKENRIEQLHWVIRKGRIVRTDLKLILDPSETRRTTRVGQILGTASEKDIKRFKRRMDRRQKRCKKKCRRKMLEKNIQKLKLRPLDLSKSCSRKSPK